MVSKFFAVIIVANLGSNILVNCLNPPNIVLIVADDYGWNDVGYHGSNIHTPTLDSLAAEGVKLENYYVQPICTPTRSQLLSGRYQIHTGLQHGVIHPCMPSGLPLGDKTLAEKLKEAGYSTHIVGKWHLGFYKKEYLPVNRGFDSHFGFLLGAEDYYTHERESSGYKGFDFRNNAEPDNSTHGVYSAHAFADKAIELIRNHNKTKPFFLYQAFQSVHGPLEVPKYYEDQYIHIKNKKRRIYSGMVAAMDEAVMNITQALRDSGIWNNTLLIFTTDNGGPVQVGANNAPLRGSKGGMYEGGIRAVGFVSGPLVAGSGGSSNHQLIHVSDWYPTIVKLAGGTVKDVKLDGYDQWLTITGKTASPRKEILHNIDPLYKRLGRSVSNVFDTSVRAALRYDKWKIITGDPGYTGWAPEPANSLNQSKTAKAKRKWSVSSCWSADYGEETCDSEGQLDKKHKNVQLFDISKDEEEKNDLSDAHPDVVDMLLGRLAAWNATAVPVHYPDIDPKCNPAKLGGFWGPWK